MKKILYIGNKLSGHGNTATSIETLGAFLEQEGFVLYYASSKKNQVLRLLDMVFTTLKLGRKVDFVMIDTYSTRNFWFAFVISQLCRILGVQYITKLHGGNLPQRLEKNPYLSDLIFKHACKVTAPSAYLMHSFAQRGYQNLVYVPNSIDISKYPYKERKTTVPKLLWVRSFSKIYNPKMAIFLLHQLKTTFPEATLCMVGPDKENLIGECRKLADEVGVEVLFTGKLSKEQWIALADDFNIFINTTHFDNTPVSLIEAMAIGLPVVSTNVGGIPFLVEDGQTALLVNDNDTDQMAAAILQLANDPGLAKKLTANARLMVESFDWQQVRQSWFEVLDC